MWLRVVTRKYMRFAFLHDNTCMSRLSCWIFHYTKKDGKQLYSKFPIIEVLQVMGV